MFEDFKKIKAFFQEMKVSYGRKNSLFLKTLRKEIAKYIEENPALELKEKPESFTAKFDFPFFHLTKLSAGIATLALLVLFGGGAIAASQKSLPGESLYPLKLFSEKVRVTLTPEGESKNDLRLQLAKNRIEEIAKAIETNSEVEAKNVATALDNFNYHLDKISEKAAQLSVEGDLQKAAQTNNALQVAVGVWTQALQEEKIRIKESDQSQNKFQATIDSLENLKLETAGQIEIFDRNEQEKARSAGMAKSAEAKIKTAEAEIKETEEYIAKREKKMATSSVESAKTNLLKAKDLLDRAKENFENENYTDAFDSANKAQREASSIQVLLKVSYNKTIFKIEQEKEDSKEEDNLDSDSDKYKDSDNDDKDSDRQERGWFNWGS